jgi:hypothetical protein
MWRDIFRYATNPEVFLDESNVRSLLDHIGLAGSGKVTDIDVSLHELVTGLESSLADWQYLGSSTYSQESFGELRRVVIAQSAPLAASLGAWLQGLSAPGVFEDIIQLKTLTLLADDIGAGAAEASRHDAFRLIARRHGLCDYAASARELVSVRGIRDPMFCLASIFYALSRRSDAFAPEIAGIDLAFRTIGLVPAWRGIADQSVGECEWSRLNLAIPQGSVLPDEHTPETLSRQIAESYTTHAMHTRVCDGIAWAGRGLLQWDRSLRDLCLTALNPRFAMAVLVQERARQAKVYHHDFNLKGKSLAQWFKEALADPFPLIDALAESRLIRPGDPGRSALINIIIRSNGPMFRVFRKEDISQIQRWIASLVPGQQHRKESPCVDGPIPFAISTARRAMEHGDQSLGLVPRSIRAAYYLLQGRALAPRTRGFAAGYVRKWLQPSKQSINKSDRSLPDEWLPGSLRAWLLDEHDKRGVEFSENRYDTMPSREEVIDSTIQLAPLTLIDGAWLQGFTDCTLASTRIGFPLFETYWDELGNGDYVINHPKIYRDVLRAMDVELPPTCSVEFAMDRRLRDESFRLPVYWLCLGKFPVTFRPEILGMNLAMELSGVGGSYRTAHQFLKHFGFPTAFVDIHNTIDNVSTGHSAWAADAIDAYMQMILDFSDPDEEWERVRTGYESLAPLVRRPSDLDYFCEANQACGVISFDPKEAYHHTRSAMSLGLTQSE